MANRRASIDVHSGYQCSVDSHRSAAGTASRRLDVGAADHAYIHGFGLPGGDPGRDRRDAPGRRHESHETAARAMFENDFAERVLPFDREAAIAFGDLFAARRRAGRPSSKLSRPCQYVFARIVPAH